MTSPKLIETDIQKEIRLKMEFETISKQAESIYVNTKEFLDVNNFIKPLLKKSNQEIIEEFIYIEDDVERFTSIIRSFYIIYNILITREDKMLDPVLKQSMIYVKDFSVLIMMSKYKCDDFEAEARLNGIPHYEGIINNNPELLELYNDMKNYFEKEIDVRKLTKGSLKTKKEHYFHDEFSTTDNQSSFHIVFQINKNCNFKCTYCYEGLDKVTEILKIEDVPEIIKGLKEFQEHLVLQNKDLLEEDKRGTKFSFSILGGEPTIVDPKITQLLTKLMIEELDIQYVMLITNTFSAAKVMNFYHPDFPKSKIKVQASYDGGIIQDEYRLTSNKKSSRELVTKEIGKLLNQGIRVMLKATLPPEAMKGVPSAVKDYLKFEDEINVNNGQGQNFSYYPTMDTTSFLMTNLRMNIKSGQEEERAKLFNDVDVTFRELLKLELDRLLDGHNAFTRWFREASYTAQQTRCSAGVSLFGLDQDGEVRYCHRTEYDTVSPFKEHSELEYGNVKPEYGKENPFIGKFEATRNRILDVSESKLEGVSHCSNCKTLTCVKCPMINIMPNRMIDTNSSGNMYLDMYSNSMNLTCELNNTISIYLYMYLKIINN